ncbi:MAG: SCP2 sterol-binding domain-containing protein [Pseudomonadota bacterium]|nr:SCP2 sterol-binding domain-containing protein [Pseudomonadota bacterium]
MTDFDRTCPPLSLAMILGAGLHCMPLAIIQPALDIAVRRVVKVRPGLFDRLDDYRQALILVAPTDLPLAFVIRPDPASPTVTVLRSANECSNAQAVIRAPVRTLMDLLEGRIDGDSSFFDRSLAIEGDTEAVLALRNAIDDAEIDLVAILAEPLGPFAAPTRLAGTLGLEMADHAEAALMRLQGAILAPIVKETAALRREVDALKKEMYRLRGGRSTRR